MKKNILIYISALSVLALSSCSDFLDKVPDTRVDLSTPEHLSLLLVNGYPSGNIALMCELSGDNFVDNNSPDDKGNRYNLDSFERIDDEIFAWEDAKANSDEDTPSDVWEKCYHAIAVANAVLDKVKEFESKGMTKEVSAQKGEALLIRAYNHFILANMFCKSYRGPELSKSLQGIPYVTKPETTVIVNYQRDDLATVYSLIEKDLSDGLPLIDDAKYDVPKYHFNKKAANAFAARFYLYCRDYEKVVKYATIALGGEGSSPATLMRTVWNKDFTTSVALIQNYISVENPGNFLLVPTYSTFGRRFGTRYASNRDGAKATVYGPGPTWSRYNFHPCYNGKLYVRGSQEYGVFFVKAGEVFEYTDKVNGIGYAHIVRCEFTAEETLLCRAEAKLYLGDKSGALADLKIWDDARQNNTSSVANPMDPLTDNAILSFYAKNDPGYGIVKPLHIDELYPCNYSVNDDILPYLQCVLHYRRIETVYDGYRWFDIKRYGLEITHKIGRDRVEVLTMDDARKAFQIPAEVISAGLTPTDRRPVAKGEAPTLANVKLVTINN